ncbi:MAG: hypothetical protein O3C63_03450 [Cyanobacteria bacterium]|nr:hypothetical protein [Cyanobacteriota bacterium]MDA1020362.1 hypothetical protein [Cyanobacteriota bacterium]
MQQNPTEAAASSGNHIVSGNGAAGQVAKLQAPTIPDRDLEILSQKRDRIWNKWQEFRSSIPETTRQADDHRKLELKTEIAAFAEELKKKGLIDSLLGVGTFGSVFKLSSGSHSVAMKFFMTDSCDSVDGAKKNLCQLEKDELARVDQVLDLRRQELQQPNRFAFVQREILLPQAQSEPGLNSLVTNIMPGSNIITDVFELDKSEINSDYLIRGLSDEYLLEYIDCIKTLSKAGIDLKDTARSQNSHYDKRRLYLFDFIGTVENDATSARLELGREKPITRALYTLMTSVQLHELDQVFYMDKHREKMDLQLQKLGSSLTDNREQRFAQLQRVLVKAQEQGIVQAAEISDAVAELKRIQRLEMNDQLKYFIFPLTDEGNNYLENIAAAVTA